MDERAKPTEVVIVGIEIRMTDLIGFLVKLAIAAVPAAIVAAFFWMVLAGIFAAIFAHH